MKTVTMRAEINQDTCIGCGICSKVCPTLAVTVEERKAEVNPDRCLACGNCHQRCPVEAVTLVRLKEPFTVGTVVRDEDREKVEEICIKAGFNPSQIVCYCTATRAEEVAAAIIQGANTPEEISFRTGLRMGCSVECIQPALRLLDAAGIVPTPPEGGWQWYGKTATLQDIPEDIKKKYNHRGFYFDSDLALFTEVAESKRR
ncbi:Ferredoxin [Pseudodesulfovibrio hydrargyri]|uniref:Ferredoxin n=1 Tax=Pseudodesulfovibrio hydrargyri TaxID=2125990 RepID=A0A1J5MVA9_9BACT|nr:4Fe-4S binding protein [Pseudodesulfovibrio hydrargyri]OIQ50534.1 Ferredoxin [Pseudodesulfovibrio hydrargyri]